MEQIKIIIEMIIDVIWTGLMIIPLILQTLYNELNRKKKDVKGQLALVSFLQNHVFAFDNRFCVLL